MKKLTQEDRETIFGIESELTTINEELAHAKGMNRRNLTEHHSARMVELFDELKSLRRLTLKEKMAVRLLSTYVNKHERANAKKIKQARSKLKNMNEKQNLGLEFDE